MSHTKEQFNTYVLMMQCLQSEVYAGKEFQDKAFEFLDRCNAENLSTEECRSGWEKLHDEYERLSEPYWQRVWERLGNRKLRQGELFA